MSDSIDDDTLDPADQLSESVKAWITIGRDDEDKLLQVLDTLDPINKAKPGAVEIPYSIFSALVAVICLQVRGVRAYTSALVNMSGGEFGTFLERHSWYVLQASEGVGLVFDGMADVVAAAAKQHPEVKAALHQAFARYGLTEDDLTADSK